MPGHAKRFQAELETDLTFFAWRYRDPMEVDEPKRFVSNAAIHLDGFANGETTKVARRDGCDDASSLSA